MIRRILEHRSFEIAAWVFFVASLVVLTEALT